MRADALVQFLVWKKWTDLFLLAGDTAGDQAYAEAIHRAAKKFGAEIVAEESYAYDPIARRTDSGHIQVQRQMPLATQGAGHDYDVLVASDANALFGQYPPFHPYDPRPVFRTPRLGDKRGP